MDVIVSQDRFTVYRATVYDDPDIDGEAFSTGERNLHLDMNPWWYLEDAEEIKLGIDKLKYEDPQVLPSALSQMNLVSLAFAVFVGFHQGE